MRIGPPTRSTSTAALCLAQLEIIRPQVEHCDRMIRLLGALRIFTQMPAAVRARRGAKRREVLQGRRRQTHSTEIEGKRYIWYTDRLWKLAQELPEFEVEVESFQELDRDCWFGPGRTPTIREVAAHCKRINEANTEIPVIINENGRLMDGGHRLARALLEGIATIKAVQFVQMPEPDIIEDLC